MLKLICRQRFSPGSVGHEGDEESLGDVSVKILNVDKLKE